MSDIVERARVMLSTIALAQSKGIGQAYPDDVVAHIVSELVGNIEQLRRQPGCCCGGCVL